MRKLPKKLARRLHYESTATLAKIYYVVGKYQLDNLIDKNRLPLTIRIVLAPTKLISHSKLSRGERLRCALEELGQFLLNLVNCCQLDQI